MQFAGIAPPAIPTIGAPSEPFPGVTLTPPPGGFPTQGADGTLLDRLDTPEITDDDEDEDDEDSEDPSE